MKYKFPIQIIILVLIKVLCKVVIVEIKESIKIKRGISLPFQGRTLLVSSFWIINDFRNNLSEKCFRIN